MPDIQRHTIAILTDTGGDYTETTPPVDGAILQVRYVRDGSNGLDTGADIDISLANSGVIVASYDNVGGASFTKVPKQPVHDTGGVAVSGLREFAFAGGEALSVSVSQSDGVTGTKRGTVHIWTG